jgi:hypothetical protein
MLKARKYLIGGVCRNCADRIECRLCSYFIGKLRGSKVVSCNFTITKRRINRVAKLAESKLEKSENQRNLFEEGS